MYSWHIKKTLLKPQVIIFSGANVAPGRLMSRNFNSDRKIALERNNLFFIIKIVKVGIHVLQCYVKYNPDTGIFPILH
jgi:hypothetical protein